MTRSPCHTTSATLAAMSCFISLPESYSGGVAPCPTQLEIDTAVADFNCADSVGLQAFVQDEVRTREVEWVEEHPGILEQIRNRRGEAVARATAATSSS